MAKKLSCRILILFFVLASSAQLFGQSYSPSASNLDARKAFQDDKFGMFIHWGASSILGNGEWVMNNRNIKVQDYRHLIDFFNPQDFNAATWVATAKAAGMKYITFITRHHDGFSNWDTRQSDWKITNTRYGKDALKQLADECHKQGIKLYCYYSLLDWYRSDYQYETGKTGKGTGRTQKSNWDSYIKFMKAQLTELLTGYGEIAGIWFDGHWDQLENDTDKKLKSKVNWHYDEIYDLIHKLQPQCLISNNHHLAPIPGEDFQAFEKDLPGHNTTGFGGQSVSALPLETCETMNDSWGYNITDRNYKSTRKLVQFLVRAACYNANLLLNIGPMPNGAIQPEFTDTLARMGAWTHKNGETIYGTRGAITTPKNWGGFTQKGNTVYMHILNKPEEGNFIFVPELKQKIQKAVLYKGGKEVKFKQQPEGTFIYLDGIVFDEPDTIIEMQIN